MTSRKHSKLGLMRRLKRYILVMAAGLFLAAATLMYLTTAPIFDSRTGSAAIWTVSHAANPILNMMPWYVWASALLIGIYLWLKHKLVMAVVLGIMAGIIGGVIL